MDTFVRGTLLAVHLHLTHATALENYDPQEMLGTPRATEALDDRRSLLEGVRLRRVDLDPASPGALPLPLGILALPPARQAIRQVVLLVFIFGQGFLRRRPKLLQRQ